MESVAPSGDLPAMVPSPSHGWLLPLSRVSLNWVFGHLPSVARRWSLWFLSMVLESEFPEAGLESGEGL